MRNFLQTIAAEEGVSPSAVKQVMGRKPRAPDAMTNMAGTNDPSDFTENLFKQWLVSQTINGFSVAPRALMQTAVLASTGVGEISGLVNMPSLEPRQGGVSQPVSQRAPAGRVNAGSWPSSRQGG